jgi:hypothetical protein
MQRMLLLGLAVTVYSFSSAMEQHWTDGQKKAYSLLSRNKLPEGWSYRSSGIFITFTPPSQFNPVRDVDINAIFLGKGKRFGEIENGRQQKAIVLTQAELKEIQKGLSSKKV